MLTRKQHELLIYIDRHLRETGFSPSFEEMKQALKLRSQVGHPPADLGAGGARLPAPPPPPGAGAGGGAAAGGPGAPATAEPAAAGRAPAREASFAPNVIRGDFSARLPGVRAAAEAGAVELPLYGRIAAGLPIEALRDTGTQIEVPMALIGSGEHYALEVAGDSMVEAGILDGDTAIIRRVETAENGQIVVALIDGSEVTLKRLRRRGASIALEPANPRHEIRIFPADRVRVQGRLVALLRRY